MATNSNRIVRTNYKQKKKSNKKKKKSMNLKSYLKIMKVCISNSNGKVLAHCFSFRTTNKRQVFDQITETALLSECKTTLNSTAASEIWTMIIFYHLKSILEMLQERFSCAWATTQTALKLLKNQIIEPTTHTNENILFDCNNVWYLPVINSMLRNFTDIAITYYQFLCNFDNDNDIIIQCFNDIMQIVRIMTADHTNRVNSHNKNGNKSIAMNDGKHTLSHGLFFTVNQIIKLCDSINNETYLNHALQEVDKFRNMWTQFPLSDVVTHLYYKGRFNYAKNDDLVSAKQELTYAFELCQKQSVNRYRILLLLIPINAMLGYLPNLQRLPKALFDRFYPIVKALRDGNILLFKRALNYYQNDFINCGIYLLLTKMDVLVFRSLIQKMYLVRKRMNESKPHIIGLGLIQKAVQIRKKQYLSGQFYHRFEGRTPGNAYERKDEDFNSFVDIDEIECVLSTLIFKKLIKGYIAHQNAVVLSTKVAFAPIKNVSNWWKSDF